MLFPLLALLQAGPPPYWQQHLSYTIEASLDESAGLLRGTQRVTYQNNSPDTLTTIAFHLYLNAFRPGSRWSDADSAEQRRRFNDLKDPDFGMNQVSNVRVMGALVTPIYPFAPDSTVVRFRLPRPLAPGASMEAELDWLARPSTVPRRQGRRGRAFDFAQWYPRVVAYDKHGWQEHPLYPAGEFYGDFGDFTVVLDVPEDQVIGATGVPLCGDPGWERANQNPARPVEYRRRFYPTVAPVDSAVACRSRGPNRKTIVWRAEQVHHFALSMRPDYRYEGGRFGDVTVHTLYQPGDERSWGGNIAVKRTEVMLEWLDSVFGKYPWPQMTNVHRIEGGGTEFPMMMHNGSASQELILHEGGHNYLMGILANNEWKEGFLDEGFTSFQTAWYFEERGNKGPEDEFDEYRALERGVLGFDLDGWSEPTSYVSNEYRDFVTYNTMIYSRGELFYHQLREIVGPEVMKRILRTYYDRWKLKHVDEGAFRQVAEEVSKRDLAGFFAQWLHGTTLYDYGLGRVKAKRRADGQWVARVEVRRKEPGVFPVEVLVRSKVDSAMVRAEGLAEQSWVEVVTRGRPREVVIDPRTRSHDWNMTNNRKTRGLFGWGGPTGRRQVYLDRLFSTRSYRDRTADALIPVVWYNEAGGVMIGARSRSNYLGRFNQATYQHVVATKNCCRDGATNHWLFRLKNPTWAYRPRLWTQLEVDHFEGRQGAAVQVEQQTKGHLSFGPTTFRGASVRWLATSDVDYLDPALYDNAGTVEATGWIRSGGRRGGWSVAGSLTTAAGVEYRNRGAGFDTESRYDTQPYLRVSAEATAKRPLGKWGALGIRAFGGLVEGKTSDPVRQRWFFLSGADPYQQLGNPFVRSREALLTDDVHFHSPGGANVRGMARGVAVTRMAALNVEADRSVLRRPNAKLFRDTRLALFGDVAATDGFFSYHGSGRIVGDAGAGVRFTHTIGQTTFVTRFDLPVYVSHPDRAIGGARDDAAFRFRWTIGFSPTF